MSPFLGGPILPLRIRGYGGCQNWPCFAVGISELRDRHYGTGLGRWASSKDPILQRYGVGALSRVATSSPRAFQAVVDAGCLSALVAATSSDDAQAQCFAAGAIGLQPPFLCICPMWVSTRHS